MKFRAPSKRSEKSSDEIACRGKFIAYSARRAKEKHPSKLNTINIFSFSCEFFFRFSLKIEGKKKRNNNYNNNKSSGKQSIKNIFPSCWRFFSGRDPDGYLRLTAERWGAMEEDLVRWTRYVVLVCFPCALSSFPSYCDGLRWVYVLSDEKTNPFSLRFMLRVGGNFVSCVLRMQIPCMQSAHVAYFKGKENKTETTRVEFNNLHIVGVLLSDERMRKTLSARLHLSIFSYIWQLSIDLGIKIRSTCRADISTIEFSPFAMRDARNVMTRKKEKHLKNLSFVKASESIVAPENPSISFGCQQ